MRVLVTSCVRELDKLGVRERRVSCKARQEEGRHAVSNIYRAVTMKIVIEHIKRCNISTVRERLRTVGEWSPHTCEKYFMQGPCIELVVGKRIIRKTDRDTSEHINS